MTLTKAQLDRVDDLLAGVSRSTARSIKADAKVEPGSTRQGANRVQDETKKAAYENLGHAARSIRKSTAASITQKKNKDVSSEPGEPPIQHSPGFFKRALRYDIGDFDAIVGFRKSIVGFVAETHEKGKTEEGRVYPERPMIEPQLRRNLDRFHSDWRSSIG